MGTVSEIAEDHVSSTGEQIDEFPEREPAEFDCPDCHGPAHCRDECDRRFAVKEADIDAWNRWYDRARALLPDSLIRDDGDRLRAPW